MRWMKHFTDARHNPKLRAIERKFGEAGYARAFKLLEIIGGLNSAGEDFVPRLDLNVPHTSLSWLADELEIRPSSAKITLTYFAKCKFIDPEEWRRNIVYVPQMMEYRDEWTRKRQPRNSVATPESLRSNSPQSQSQSQITDKELEGDDKLRNQPPDQKLTTQPPLSSNGKSDLTEKSNLTGDSANHPRQPDGLPAWMLTDPWTFLGIDRHRIPKRFRLDADDDDSPNFEARFKSWWGKYRLECREAGEEGTPEEFAEYALEQSEKEGIEYPPVLLKRKKELEAA